MGLGEQGNNSIFRGRGEHMPKSSRTGDHITQTRPCNIQQYFTAVKMLIFR